MSGTRPLAASVKSDMVLQQNPLQLLGDFLSLAIVFFLLAMLGVVVGADGVADASMAIAKWFVLVFFVLSMAAVVL